MPTATTIARLRRSAMLLAAALAAGAPAAAQQPSPRDRWADSAARLVESAVPRGDRAALGAARVLLDRALVAFPDDALLLHYQGYALWREAALVLGMRKPDEARPLLEAADRALERAAAGRPLPETLALHASVLGQRIAVGGMADGIRFGPRSGALMGEAERAGPRNPRVWLLRGMNAMFAPAAFGGGLDRAETALRRAAALFESDRAAPPAPTWGQADVHVALGQVYAKQGRRDEARAAYRQVLALQPDNAWVRSVLLPALDRPSR